MRAVRFISTCTLWILDFDSECMPDAYLGGDFTTRRLTGIAAQFIGLPDTSCWLLHRKGKDADHHIPMLEGFRKMWDKADLVTGHNLLRHDIPIINGHMVYYGLKPLSPKMVSDTYLHGPKVGGTLSRSQENLGETFGILADKYHLNNARWKRANTLEPDQVALTQERVISDVHMHIQLRGAMIARSLLKSPKAWAA